MVRSDEGSIRELTRRKFLSISMAAGSGLVLAACGGSAAPPSSPPAPASAGGSAGSAAPGSAKPASSAPASRASAGSVASGGSSAPATPAASSAGAYSPRPLNPVVTLKFSSIQGLGNGVYWIGLDRGFFKDEGLDVQFVNIASATEAIPQVAANNIDAGTLVAGAAVFNSVNRDIPVKIVADAGQLRPGFGASAIVVRKDLIDSGAFKELKDLKGRSVAITGKGVLTHYLIGRAAESVGLDADKDLNLVVMQVQDMMPALAAKQVDIAEPVEPFMAQGIAQGIAVDFKGYDELFPNTQVTTLMFSPKLVRDNKDLGVRLMTAWLRSVTVFNAAFGPDKKDYDAIVQLLATNSKLSPDIVKKAKVLGYDPKGMPNVADINTQQDWYVKKGFVKNPVNVQDVLDLSLLQTALQKLGMA